MPKLGGKFAEVDSDRGACAKPACMTGSRTLHRHHRKHEAIWIGVWKWRGDTGEQKFLEFVRRYHSFVKEDWVCICEAHHAEVHLIYDQIIKADKRMLKKSLTNYSWPQAEKLMEKLEAACMGWLKAETPGITSERLDQLRTRSNQFFKKRGERLRPPDFYND